MFLKGQVVSIMKLRNAYDAYVLQVIGEFFSRQEGKRIATKTKKGRNTTRRAAATFKVVKTPPDKAEYDRLKREKYTTTIGELISDAYSEVESLAGEVRDWYDNLPESFQSGDKGDRLSEAADALENISDSTDLPQPVSDYKVVYYPSLDSSSRADRASDAAAMLRAAVEGIDDYIEDQGEKFKDDDGLEGTKGELENHADEIEGVEFPGMFD